MTSVLQSVETKVRECSRLRSPTHTKYSAHDSDCRRFRMLLEERGLSRAGRHEIRDSVVVRAGEAHERRMNSALTHPYRERIAIW